MKPIKILGFPRSGTSLLQRLLTSHKDLHCPPETYVFSGLARMIQESTGEGPNLGMLTGLNFAGFEETDILTRVREFGFSILDEAAAKAGKAAWAEKSAFDIFYLSELELLLENHCRFVCVVRNPLDVISSMKELSDQMGQNVPEMRPWMAQFDSYYLAWAAAWRDQTKKMIALHQRQGEQSLLYKYEDLVINPNGVLERIAKFAGLSSFAHTDIAASGQIGLGDWKVISTKQISKASVERWRTKLPKSSARACLELVQEEMELLGYDVPKINAPVSRQARIKQYQRAKLMSLALKQRNKKNEPST